MTDKVTINASNDKRDAAHALFVKIAEELFKMEVRLGHMPADVKGVNALKNNVRRIRDELAVAGYGLVDFTGAEYDDGMNVQVSDFIPADDIAPGQRRIVRTVRPQVTYKNGIISQGEVEVAVSRADAAKP